MARVRVGASVRLSSYGRQDVAEICPSLFTHQYGEAPASAAPNEQQYVRSTPASIPASLMNHLMSSAQSALAVQRRSVYWPAVQFWGGVSGQYPEGTHDDASPAAVQLGEVPAPVNTSWPQHCFPVPH